MAWESTRRYRASPRRARAGRNRCRGRNGGGCASSSRSGYWSAENGRSVRPSGATVRRAGPQPWRGARRPDSRADSPRCPVVRPCRPRRTPAWAKRTASRTSSDRGSPRGRWACSRTLRTLRRSKARVAREGPPAREAIAGPAIARRPRPGSRTPSRPAPSAPPGPLLEAAPPAFSPPCHESPAEFASRRYRSTMGKSSVVPPSGHLRQSERWFARINPGALAGLPDRC